MGEELYELPTGWVFASIGELCHLINGKAFKPVEWSSEGLPIVRIQNLNDREASFNYCNFEVENKYIIDDGQLLFAWSGTPGTSFGAHIWNRGKAVLNQHIFRLEINEELISKKFFLYVINFKVNEYIQKAHGTAGLAHITKGKFEESLIPLPPIPEQYRIVDKIEELFTELDAGVELLKKLKTKLKRYRQAVLKAAVEGSLTKEWREANQGKLEPASILLERILKQRREKWEAEQLAKMKAQGKTPKDDSWKLKYKEPIAPDTSELPELPDGWCWVRAEQICDFITKGTTPKAEKLYSCSGDIPFIKVYNLTFDGSMNFSINPTFIDRDTHSKELARSKVFPRDVLMNIVGPPLGKVSVVPELYPEWNMNQAMAVFRPMPSYSRMFLAFSLMSKNILSWAESRAKATAGQFNLTLEICRDLPLPLLPELEQKYIVENLEFIFSVIDQLEKTIDANLKRSKKLRQSILKQAFEGKLVPQDPNDEPAEKLLERIKAEKAKQTTTKTKKKTQSKTQSNLQLELPLK